MKRGRPLNGKHRLVQVAALRLDREWTERLYKLAEQEHRTYSNMMRVLLMEAIEQREGK